MLKTLIIFSVFLKKKIKGTFPVRIMTPIVLSFLASLKARISSLIVCGRNAFLLSSMFIVICKIQRGKSP
ncbi:hypothetical protein Hanom_Chr10g00894541 [Helianthus anomalus]